MTTNIGLQDKIKMELIEISSTINGIVESYKQLHSPLIESKKDVPRATEQLDKITEQTEAATTRMLDTIEIMTQRGDEISAGLTELKKEVSINKIASTKLEAIIQKAADNNNDTFMIMDALQFQDITSQQINHAVVLLEDLESKLNNILSVLNGGVLPEVPSSNNKKVRAYDPNADLFEKKTDQQDIDNIFSKK